MKYGTIKDYEPITDETLAEINKLAKRPLTADEVYAFSMILCDNEVDRDIERFTLDALVSLSSMFVGKTGLIDHRRSADSQTARLYKAVAEMDAQKLTSTGEPYCFLLGSAYIPRIDKTDDIIANIDAGIMKEVSVGVNIGKMTCSICGKPVGMCMHVKGMTYDGQLCYTLLDDPIDAYEFSFVAIPAQPNAGVVKSFDPAPPRLALKRKILKIFIGGILHDGKHERV